MANGKSSFSVFKRAASEAHDGLLLKPQIQTYFYRARFPDEFTITFRKAGEPRHPDGYFHPSTHPSMNVTQLYWYLKASHSDKPEKYWEHEQLSYESRISVMMGTALHELVQSATTELGIMDKPSGTCPACGKSQPDECNEQGVMDNELMTRGHMDDVLKNARGKGPAGVDYKSTTPKNLYGVEDHDLAFFKKKWPYYYGQAQSYMHSTGLRTFVFLFIAWGHPWAMKEFIVPYDVEYCMDMESKYRLAMDHFQRGEAPNDPCCDAKYSSRCPVVLCPRKK